MNLKTFGGTNKKLPADPTHRQVGHFSATPGASNISNNSGAADTKAYRPKTGKFYHPTIKGKSTGKVGC